MWRFPRHTVSRSERNNFATKVSATSEPVCLRREKTSGKDTKKAWATPGESPYLLSTPTVKHTVIIMCRLPSAQMHNWIEVLTLRSRYMNFKYWCNERGTAPTDGSAFRCERIVKQKIVRAVGWGRDPPTQKLGDRGKGLVPEWFDSRRSMCFERVVVRQSE